MNINWKVRLKNKDFWLTIIPMALLLIQAVLSNFGVTIDIGEWGNKLLTLVNLVFAILATLGIVNDPTTKTFADSERALTYNEPN